jgi:alpha-L-fucosidase
MKRQFSTETLVVLALALVGAGCSGGSGGNGSGGAVGRGGAVTGGSPATGTGGSGSSSAGGSAAGGSTSQGGSKSGGSPGVGGSATAGTSGTGGSAAGGSQAQGGSASGGSAVAGASTGGASGSGGVTGGGGSTVAGSGGASTGGSSGVVDFTTIPICPPSGQTGGPPPTAQVPTAAQAAYQHTEMTAFLHFGLDTFDGTEQGNTSDTPALFNPTNLDVNQWVQALKNAGFKQAMLVAKHSIGFCLWPSKYTEFSVKNSPWMGGKGDVVKLFTDAMHAAGMRVGLYYGPWDQKYPSTKADYGTYFKNQVTELLSNYGPVYELWLDGHFAPGSVGYPATVDWKEVFDLAHQLQPNIVVEAGPELAEQSAAENPPGYPDVQWIGNESGQSTRTASSLNDQYCGGKDRWCPNEADTSSRGSSTWFWHPGQSPISLGEMQSIFFRTVGMNATLNFNVPPSQTGQFDAADTSLLQQFGTWYSSTFKTNLAKQQPATADSTWATAGFEAAKAFDDDVCTFWAAASGKTSGRLEVTPAAALTINVISIREPIEIGERVTKYHVELKQNGTWNTSPTDASGAKMQGTVVGQRQLWQLKSTKADAVALVIDSAKDVPAIAEFSVY